MSIFAFLNCTYCTNCTKLNWDTEIFGVWWTAPELIKNYTKIVKFSASDESFFGFIFNYELDIFYPFFKNDKIAFLKFIYKVLNFTAPTAPTAPNSTEIQKSSTSVEYRVIINCTWHCTNCTKLNWDKEIFVSDELHQLHLNCTNCTWELHLTAPTAPELHQYGNLRCQLMMRGFFFIIICGMVT